ncbi:hypothetical protein MON38_09160 [Hymenobacter sp. DH14]|uniref:Uncharacterized protein n=1 Tax=Hymenobacter cyanobacteriorum TaxID=2926463 RepID=A0A9X1VF68_9BACT|nr:hypothetical protein [Hymenobacter cyanobacteriorum]MCI1187587.1 hypothetical protein [Hymenobacter cyanobacteriorum]
MSTEKLAFLQNFYTDVTLYVPAEAGTPAPGPAAADAPAVAPAVTAPDAPVAAAKPTPPPAPAPEPRVSSMPSTGFSKPSAGLERLTSSILSPPVAAPVPAASPAPAPPAATPGVPPATLTPFATLGSNAAGVLLLCRLPREQFVKLHRNVFLNKMLQALGLVMEDVLLVNVESELPVALASLRQQLDATHIIAFGKNLLDVTIRNTQIYEPVLFPSLNLSYLASATIELVEYDVSLKKRLWPGLQAMFLNRQ